MKNRYSKEWLTREEYSRLINNIRISRRDELVISLLYGCALRVGELSDLKVKDIDLKKRTLVIWVSKRSIDPALVPVPFQTLKMINQWITENSLTPNSHLFFSQRSRKLSRPQIYRIIQENGIKAGIKKKLTTHSLRRSRATNLLDAGLPIEKVSKLLRHKNISSTIVYLNISIQALQSDIEKIDSIDNDIIF